MSSSFNIIGDIAGQFKTLQALLAKMPEGEPISVGDMIDRGPQSKEVVEFFMKNGRAVMGNHEDMFIQFLAGKEGKMENYPVGCYLRNGGMATVEGFTDEDGVTEIPTDWVNYLITLPKKITLEVDSDDLLWDGCIITHAPIHSDAKLRVTNPMEYGLLWNRDKESVERIDNMFQISGHNAHLDSCEFHDDRGVFGKNLDTYKNVLIGMHWPSMVLYEQEFIK